MTDANLNNDTQRPRTTWRRPFLIVAMLLLFSISLLVGLLVRPTLSPTETRLIGTWRNTVTNVSFTFHDDRSVTRAGVILPHRWRISDGILYTQNPLSAASRIFGRSTESALPITFDNDDNVTAVYPLNGGIAYWQRMPRNARSLSRVTRMAQ